VGELTIRHSTDEDVEAILEVAHRAFERHTGRRAHWTAQGMRRMRALPLRDPGADFPVVLRGEQVVAWAGVFANPPYTEIFTDVHVDPDLSDDDATSATRLLVEHAAARGHEVAAGSPPVPGRTVAIEALDTDPRLVADLERLGFARDRLEYEMAVELDDDVPEPDWPDDVTVAPMRGPEDTEVVTAILADAFADHPGDVPFSADVLRHVLGGEDHDAAASAIVHDADGPAGLVLGRGRPGAGYVWVLGVVTRARRRGLGARLLQHAFHAYAAAGTSLVLLDVDGSNDSGALTVYANAGMTARTTKIVLTRPLTA
jgi:ribosomal protein S18 acetylase RimI-like enzyme